MSRSQPSFLCKRLTSCCIAVKKPLELKKPISQYVFSLAILISEFIRCSREPRDLDSSLEDEISSLEFRNEGASSDFV